MPSHMDANATDALTALAAIWAQMRFVRLAVLVFSRGAPLTDWLRGPDRVTCALRVSALAALLWCIAAPSPVALFATLTTTLALGWACLP